MNENSQPVRIEFAGRSILQRLASIVLTLSLLSACATQRGSELPPLSDWETRQNVLSTHPEWAFTGSIGVRAGQEGFNGKVRWHQQADDYETSVSGPLGMGTVRITGNSQRISVTEKDGTVTELSNAEDDLRAIYGWTIPVASLRYWALGIPDPASAANTEFGDDGQLIHLEQRDWIVSIAEYREGGGQLVPRRIVAINADAKVTLFIRRWTFF